MGEYILFESLFFPSKIKLTFHRNFQPKLDMNESYMSIQHLSQFTFQDEHQDCKGKKNNLDSK